MLLFPIPKKYYKLVLLTIADAIRREDEEVAQAGGAGRRLTAVQPETAAAGPSATFAKPALEIAPNGPSGAGAWTVHELARLRSLLRPSSAALAMLNLTAANPGRPVRFSDICKAAQRTPYGGRSDIGGLTKLCRNHVGHTELPVSWEKSLAEEGETLYTMTPEMAALWTRSA